MWEVIFLGVCRVWGSFVVVFRFIYFVILGFDIIVVSEVVFLAFSFCVLFSWLFVSEVLVLGSSVVFYGFFFRGSVYGF